MLDGSRDDAVLRALDDLHFAHLRLDLAGPEAAVDDADAALLRLTIAIGARVTVSMLADTIGRFSVSAGTAATTDRSTDGSRRSRTLRCGDRMKSSNVQPCTSSSTRRPTAASMAGNADMPEYYILVSVSAGPCR